jgi:hypothetical protein
MTVPFTTTALSVGGCVSSANTKVVRAIKNSKKTNELTLFVSIPITPY